MKRGTILLIILVIGIASISFLLKSNKETVAKKAIVGLPSPDFELTDTDGKVWRLSDLKGKVVLVNFWATWCDTCKEEKPYFNSIFSGNFKDNVVYLSVLFNDDPSNAVRYKKEMGYDFPVLIDDKSISSLYGITGIPETFMINKKGILVKKIVGGVNWNISDFNESLKTLVNET